MDSKKECHCNPMQIQRYLSKISGPLLDRIDIHLEVQALPTLQLMSPSHSEKSETIKKRTLRAHQIQQERFGGTGIFSNAKMKYPQIKEYCQLDSAGKDLLRRAIEELNLSARAYDKVLKISRTIADLDGQDHIQSDHVAEAIQYRCLDRNWWGS